MGILQAREGDHEVELVDNDNKEIKEVVMEVAREHRCEPEAIKLQGIEYSEDFEW